MRVSYRLTLGLFLILLMGLANAAMPRDPEKFFFEQTLGDLAEDLVDAKSKGKKGIMIFFEQEECPFCHRMKTTILNQVEVQDYYLKNFLVLSMDIESTEDITDFKGEPTTRKKYFAKIAKNRGATPVLAFFDLEGNLTVRYTGAAAGVEEVLWLGEYASQEVYKKMPFSKYKRVKRKEQRQSPE